MVEATTAAGMVVGTIPIGDGDMASIDLTGESAGEDSAGAGEDTAGAGEASIIPGTVVIMAAITTEITVPTIMEETMDMDMPQTTTEEDEIQII